MQAVRQEAAAVAVAGGELSVVHLGKLTLNVSARVLQVGDRQTTLTVKETELLAYFIARAGEALPREQVFREVWGYELDCNTNSLDVYVYRLRRYLEEDPANPQFLQTVRGFGYRFVISPDLSD